LEHLSGDNARNVEGVLDKGQCGENPVPPSKINVCSICSKRNYLLFLFFNFRRKL